MEGIVSSVLEPEIFYPYFSLDLSIPQLLALQFLKIQVIKCNTGFPVKLEFEIKHEECFNIDMPPNIAVFICTTNKSFI